MLYSRYEIIALPLWLLVILWLLRPPLWKGLAVTVLTVVAVVYLQDLKDHTLLAGGTDSPGLDFYRALSCALAFQVLLAAVILGRPGLWLGKPKATADQPREAGCSDTTVPPA
jgi:hypothetical protein